MSFPFSAFVTPLAKSSAAPPSVFLATVYIPFSRDLTSLPISNAEATALVVVRALLASEALSIALVVPYIPLSILTNLGALAAKFANPPAPPNSAVIAPRAADSATYAPIVPYV